MARSDAGILYLGGSFKSCGPVEARNVVAYDPASGEFTAMAAPGEAGLEGRVWALLTAGSVVYAAGNFPGEGSSVSLLARWDGASWTRLGMSTQSAIAGLVAGRSLAMIGGDLYLGGLFNQVEGIVAYGVARWDGSSWHALGAGVENGIGELMVMTGRQVNALASHGPDLVIGGTFVQAGGQTALGVARWNGESWSPMGAGFDGVVYALLSHGDDLYAAGGFSRSGFSGPSSVQVSRVARWGGAGWLPLESDASEGLEGQDARGLARADDGALYVTGWFHAAGGNVARGAARWHNGSWSSLPVADDATRLAVGHALLVDQDKVFVGGSFDGSGIYAHRGIAFWQAGEWRPLVKPEEQQGLSNPTRQLIDFQGRPCALEWALGGGDWVSCWSGQGWRAIPVGDGLGGWASVAAGDERSLILGGSFEEVDGVAARRVARWDGTAWKSLGNGSENGVDGQVTALALAGDHVYVAGAFTQAGTVPANGVARWDGSQWTALGTTPDNSLGIGTVKQLLFWRNQLVAVGTFSRAGGEPTQGLARWNGQRWAPLDVGLGDGVHGRTEAATVDAGSLYVAGWYSHGDTAIRVARLADGQWASLLNQWLGIRYLHAIVVVDDTVFVGGEFSEIDGVPVHALAAYRDGAWRSVGAMDGDAQYPTDVTGLVAIDGYLYAGGWFRSVDGMPSKNFARYEPGVMSGVHMSLFPRTVLHAGGEAGNQVLYEVDIENRGASAAAAQLSMNWFPMPSVLSWVCEPLALTPADCPQDAGSSPIEWSAALPAGTGMRVSVHVEPESATVFQEMEGRLRADAVPGSENETDDHLVVIVPVADEAVFRGGFERHR